MYLNEFVEIEFMGDVNHREVSYLPTIWSPLSGRPKACLINSGVMKCGILFFIFAIAALFTCNGTGASASPDDKLRGSIDSIISAHDGTVGVAVLCDGNVLAAGDTAQLPLMSIFKLHGAIALLGTDIDIDSLITVDSTNLALNTYSPIRDSIGGGSAALTVDRLLQYSVGRSDNNACDILIDLAGGIDRIDRCIRDMGISGCTLSETEATMHEDILRSYRNKSTAEALCRVMEAVYGDKVLTPDKCGYLRSLLQNSTTGREKIASGLPAGAFAGHKSGMSDRDAGGMRLATGDVAAIALPDGRMAFLAILVKDSHETSEQSASLFKEIAEAVYGSLTNP